MKDENINILVGKNIRFYREQKGWTLEELAERSGYDVTSKKSSMSKIENGNNDIPTSRLFAIANALGVDVTDLTNRDASLEAKRIQACDLLEECYGNVAYTIVQKFLRLDTRDQAKVEERIDMLLENQKYQDIKVSKGDTSTIASAI